MINTNGVTWHAIVQEPDAFEASKALLTGTLGTPRPSTSPASS